MQIGKAARSNGSHIKSRLKMEPHGVFKEVTKQCTNKDHYQSVLKTQWAVFATVINSFSHLCQNK
jgi:hypothetical protein